MLMPPFSILHAILNDKAINYAPYSIHNAPPKGGGRIRYGVCRLANETIEYGDWH